MYTHSVELVLANNINMSDDERPWLPRYFTSRALLISAGICVVPKVAWLGTVNPQFCLPPIAPPALCGRDGGWGGSIVSTGLLARGIDHGGTNFILC